MFSNFDDLLRFLDILALRIEIKLSNQIMHTNIMILPFDDLFKLLDLLHDLL